MVDHARILMQAISILSESQSEVTAGYRKGIRETHVFEAGADIKIRVPAKVWREKHFPIKQIRIDFPFLPALDASVPPGDRLRSTRVFLFGCRRPPHLLGGSHPSR